MKRSVIPGEVEADLVHENVATHHTTGRAARIQDATAILKVKVQDLMLVDTTVRGLVTPPVDVKVLRLIMIAKVPSVVAMPLNLTFPITKLTTRPPPLVDMAVSLMVRIPPTVIHGIGILLVLTDGVVLNTALSRRVVLRLVKITGKMIAMVDLFHVREREAVDKEAASVDSTEAGSEDISGIKIDHLLDLITSRLSPQNLQMMKCLRDSRRTERVTTAQLLQSLASLYPSFLTPSERK